MRRFAHLAAAFVAVGLAFAVAPAFADDHEHGAADAHAEHAGHDAHQTSGEHEQPFNWADGFLGESDEEAPGLLYRPKGTPPPFLANIINAGILFYVLISASKKPVAEALKKRKERLIGAMEEAGKMRDEAQVTLSQYEEKLKRLDEEVARIRRELREAAQVEQQKILTEAKERRARMERDAALLVEQERKAARETLIRETVNSALQGAEEILQKQLGEADKDRMAKDFLGMVRTSPLAAAKGGAS